MEGEDGASAPSTPVTPGTPGAPLFAGFRNGNGRRSSLLRSSCKCFNVESWSLEEGALPPVSCSLPHPPISLARKVCVWVCEVNIFFLFKSLLVEL